MSFTGCSRAGPATRPLGKRPPDALWSATQRQTVASIAQDVPFLHRYADQHVRSR